MIKLTIKGKKLKLRERNKWERKDSYKRYIDSVKSFNELIEKLNGKTVEIARINQAIAIFNYSHATAPGCPPAYWTANIDSCFGYELGELSLRANYRNRDVLNIL